MILLRIALTLGLFVLAADLRAATTPAGRTEDLGQGLTYVRPANNNAESLALLKAVTAGPAVLDLRYFSAGENAAGWIAAIKSFATPKRICLVLVSPETTPELLSGLAPGAPGCVMIGRTSPALNVAISVDTPADTDRKAWDAIVQGAVLEKLITATLDKPRYDEAVLAKEHAADINGDDSEPKDAAAPDSPKKTDDPKAPAKPKPLVDAVLQRAVQIDRGLLALRRL
ncbi:MAG: hypothetical protein WC661_03130 [Opitutaceae bacterium]|jgi:hypothetical protein